MSAEFIKVPEMALLLRVSRPTVRKLIREGAFPTHLVGNHNRARRSDFMGFQQEFLKGQAGG
ncbi:helix-turn-helix domain-containing protein [Microbacterium testaceum]|uniref:Helix-turn-helix domain-containing protein n=1 Tax=Microbacterium testaceum TaxID=2033 RepID=A0A2T7VQZ7_MICTE|nr:helix-turn-helix domain-containing protein [Microbacterium testaceum]PVE58768.1 hypothetical protein DC432_15770 [Microbacterium testaceum]